MREPDGRHNQERTLGCELSSENSPDSAGAKKRQASYPDFNILGDRHGTGNDRVDVRV